MLNDDAIMNICSDPFPRVYVPEYRVKDFDVIQESQIQPASLDVRLGRDFIRHPDGEKIRLLPGGEYRLSPGECVLGMLVERFSLPLNLVGRVEGKSTWARKFLTVHSAGFIDPGFTGDITLELKNDGKVPLLLPVGANIAQISFQRLEAPARRAYGTRGLNSHYQGQEGVNGPWDSGSSAGV